MVKPHFLKSLETTELPVHQKTLKESQWWRACFRWKADGPEFDCHLWSFPIWNTKPKMHIFRNSLKRSKINNWFCCTIHTVTGPGKQAAQNRGQVQSWGEANLTQNTVKSLGLPQMGTLFTGTITAQAHTTNLKAKKRLCRSVFIPLKTGKIPTLSESYPLILYHCRMFLFILKFPLNCTQCMSLHGWFRATQLSSASILSQRPVCCSWGVPWQINRVFRSRSAPGGRSFIIHGWMR